MSIAHQYRLAIERGRLLARETGRTVYIERHDKAAFIATTRGPTEDAILMVTVSGHARSLKRQRAKLHPNARRYQ